MRAAVYLSFVIGIITVCAGCKSSNPEFELLNQIEGTWEMKFDQSVVYEEWTKLNDTLFSGRSYEVSGGDTTITETLQILDNSNGIFYIPTVTNQNDGLPVSFKLTSREGTRFTFENPQHDFPTSIVYDFLSENKLNASVSGIIGGSMRSLDFEYTRIK
jgi:hypothetical protein